MRDRAVARANAGLAPDSYGASSNTEVAVRKMRKGQIHRAQRAIVPTGLADIPKPEVLDDLLGRFRKRGDELLPLSAEFESYTPLKADLRAHFRSLDNGRGTSLSGCRNEYL